MTWLVRRSLGGITDNARPLAEADRGSHIETAQLLIARRYHETIIVEQLARELHVGYSSFRQAFKAQTGLSPKQYQLQIRLQKAQEFLANTSKSVGEIAEILGFNTAYQLSNQFKKNVGLAPQIWRQRLERCQRR